MNLYEQAVERCEKAAQATDMARAAYKAALDEQSQALTQLAWYEEKPGIPRAEYRGGLLDRGEIYLDTHIAKAARELTDPATGMTVTEKPT